MFCVAISGPKILRFENNFQYYVISIINNVILVDQN